MCVLFIMQGMYVFISVYMLHIWISFILLAYNYLFSYVYLCVELTQQVQHCQIHFTLFIIAVKYFQFEMSSLSKLIDSCKVFKTMEFSHSLFLSSPTMNSINIFTFTGTCMPGMLQHYDAVLLYVFFMQLCHGDLQMLSCVKRLEEDFVNFAINSLSKY